ncbi:MAG: hypothetical protein CFE37_07000 [Alphaproteobacteria bacterium PA4]|nr:MAG: hypothetical protein CFE37_07000 [Alphaproteobacteria bacterium PA4]
MTSLRPWPGLNRRQLLAAPLALATAARARPVVPELPLPPVVDLSALLGPAKQQGDRMTCAYFAATALAEAAVARQTGLPVIFSEQYLTDIKHGGSRLPADETVDLYAVMDIVQDFGMVPASARPYLQKQVPGELVQRPDAALLALGKQVKLQMYMLPYSYRIEDLQRRMLRRPAVVGLALPHNAAGWRDDGLVEPVPGLVPSGEDAREDFPNHFVAVTGYDLRQQMFHFRNSWGADWGRGGYGRISFATMRTNFWAHGDAFMLAPA